MRVLRVLNATLLAVACLGVTAFAPSIDAKPGKNGKNKHAADCARKAPLGIPPGQLPPAGQCRIWYPGKPPGHQPAAGKCRTLKREVPAGAWLLYRPEAEHVQVSVIHEADRQRVVEVGLYTADLGLFVKYER